MYGIDVALAYNSPIVVAYCLSGGLHVAAGSSLHKFTLSEEFNVSLTIKRIYRMLEKPKSKGNMNLLPKYQNLFNCIFLYVTATAVPSFFSVHARIFYSFADCISLYFTHLLIVCVCVCVCLCVCVCVFIFFHHEGFFRLQDVQDILERDGPTTFCCEYLYGCFCQVPSSPCLKVLNFTSKGENSSLQHTGEKTI